MSFGNSPSTVRQFRRVSPSAENGTSAKQSPPPDSENLPPQASGSNATPTETKEALLGRRAYSKAIGLACQEILNNTADQTRRETISRLAEGFSDLEQEDPEGMYHIIKLVIEKIILLIGTSHNRDHFRVNHE